MSTPATEKIRLAEKTKRTDFLEKKCERLEAKVKKASVGKPGFKKIVNTPSLIVEERLTGAHGYRPKTRWLGLRKPLVVVVVEVDRRTWEFGKGWREETFWRDGNLVEVISTKLHQMCEGRTIS